MAIESQEDSQPDAPAGAAGDPVVQGPAEPAVEPESYWLRMRRRGDAARERGETFVAELERKRPENAVIEVGFRVLGRDKRIAGGLLGGGLAYRFFFWTLALMLLSSGGLGLAVAHGTDVQKAFQSAGLSQAVSGDAASAAAQSRASHIWLLIVGSCLTVWFSWGLLRSLRLVHAAAWGVDLPKLERLPRGLASVIAVPVALVLLTGMIGWLKAQLGLLPGLLATLGLGFGMLVFWIWVESKLPSKQVPWTAYIPGAALMAVGYFAMHLFAVYFLADKIASASNLYGALGLASALLVYLFMIGRIVVWAAELNAVSWEVREERRV